MPIFVPRSEGQRQRWVCARQLNEPMEKIGSRRLSARVEERKRGRVLDHFLHDHPLKLIKKVNDDVVCSGCHKGLEGRIYGCENCKWYLHKSCAQLPREIQNFFHPCPLLLHIGNYICNACFEEGSGFIYRCKRCDFDMHVNCAQRPTIESEEEELIHHFTHWRHPLTLIDQKKDFAGRCGICEKLCSWSSDSSVYGCEECGFFLHNSCMINIPREIEHFLHPTCPLILLTVQSYKCASCDEFGSGLVFGCGKCNFQLGVKCALHSSTPQSRKHPLSLLEKRESDGEIRCRACGKNCLGPCLGCDSRSCELFTHASHAELPERIHHPFHPLHPLTRSPLPSDPDYDNYKCLACLGLVDKFILSYHCAECDVILHADCAEAKFAPILKYGGHPHPLNFFDKTCSPIPCRRCNADGQSCILRCVACEFNMHLYCHPSAPKTIRHKYHLHPLTLAESSFEFELVSPEYEDISDNDEFYCDVCEEKRYGFESVYYCEECRFIAEIPCVKSELLPSFTTSKDQSEGSSINEENSAMEASIELLSKQIAKFGAKKERLEAKIKKLQARVDALQKELSPIKDRLEDFVKNHSLFTFHLTQNKNKYATEASNSEGSETEASTTEGSATEASNSGSGGSATEASNSGGSATEASTSEE